MHLLHLNGHKHENVTIATQIRERENRVYWNECRWRRFSKTPTCMVLQDLALPVSIHPKAGPTIQLETSKLQHGDMPGVEQPRMEGLDDGEGWRGPMQS